MFPHVSIKLGQQFFETTVVYKRRFEGIAGDAAQRLIVYFQRVLHRLIILVDIASEKAGSSEFRVTLKPTSSIFRSG